MLRLPFWYGLIAHRRLGVPHRHHQRRENQSPLGQSRGLSAAITSRTKPKCKPFFKRAILITPRQEHDYFLYGPCTAEGSFKTRYGHWGMENAQWGHSLCGRRDGQSVCVFADPKQESGLGE